MVKESASSLRDDFDIFKTQMAICASCIGVIILVLICGLIYVFFAVRKVKKQFEAKISNLEATRRFTISRPKLYSSSDPTSKLQGEIGKVVNMDYGGDSKQGSRDQPSPLPAINSPQLGYLNQGYGNLGSPGLGSNYANLNSPSNFPNTGLQSPLSPNADRNINRVESFLNKTRQLYYSPRSDVSPHTPRTPNGNRDGTVFKFS